MINLSFGKKIFVGFFIIIVLSVSLSALSFVSLNKVNDLALEIVPLGKEIVDIQQHIEGIKNLENEIETYLMIKSEENKSNITATLDTILSQIQSSVGLQAGRRDKDVGDLLNSLLALKDNINKIFVSIGNNEPASSLNRYMVLLTKNIGDIEALRKKIVMSRVLGLENTTNRQVNIISTVQSQFLFIQIGILSVIVILAVIILIYGRNLARRVRQLVDASNKISVGQLDVQIDTSGRDEITELAESIERLQDSVNMSIARLGRRKGE